MNTNFVQRWERLIAASGRTPKDLSVAVGKDGSYFSKLFSTARSNTKKQPDPGASIALKLAGELGISIDDLMGLTGATWVEPDPAYQREVYAQSAKILTDIMKMARSRLAVSGNRPSIEDVVYWWHNQGGRLLGVSQIEENFDLIHVPRTGDKMVRPFRVGANSLAAHTLGTNSACKLAKLVGTLSQGEQSKLTASYRDAANKERPTISKPLSITICLPQTEFWGEVEYIRLQLPVVSPDNTPFILSYCVAIEPGLPSRSDML